MENNINEQETVQEVLEKEEETSLQVDNTSVSADITNASTDLSNDDEGISSNDSTNIEQQTESVVEQPSPVPSQETPIETTQEIIFDTTLIEEKLDNIIALQNQQVSNGLFGIGFIVVCLVVYLLYSFLNHFVDF